MKQIYLDNAATTRVDKNIAEVVREYLTEKYGNASSLHFKGEEAKKLLEGSRKTIAGEIGAKFREIIFTGSGTEANNSAIKGLFFKNYPEKDHIITTKVEHDCILGACKWIEKQGGKVTYLDVDEEGFIDLDELEKAITEKTILVSVIHGNNEVGAINDIRSIGKICKSKEVLFHTDACQSFTKVPINVVKDNLDLVTLNAHKIHGPKGVGALFIKEGVKIEPLLHGGGQEFKLRSSTENIPGIVGFGEAVRTSSKKDIEKMERYREYLIEKILENVPGSKLNGPRENRLCNNVNICFGNIEGEAISSFLNEKGIMVSAGSACSSKSIEPSHVLLAMGLTKEEANSSIRFSLSKYNTKEELEYTVKELKKIVKTLREVAP